MQILLKNTVVNYEQLGNGPEDLLILHGWGQSLSLWKQVALFCSKRYRVTTIDFPGFGSSEEPDDTWDTYGYAEFTKEFIERIGIRNPVVMGHSFGGRIGTILAVRYPELVGSLILVDSGGIEIKSWSVRFRIFIYKLIIRPSKFLFGNYLKKIFGSTGYKSASQTMRRVLVNVVNQDLRYLFVDIKQPVTVIWGSADKVLPVKYVKIYHRMIPQSDIKILWGADHNPHLSQPVELVSLLGDLLKL